MSENGSDNIHFNYITIMVKKKNEIVVIMVIRYILQKGGEVK